MRGQVRSFTGALLMTLLVVACTTSPNPSLDVSSFEMPGGHTDSDGQIQPCGYGAECFTLQAVADGTKAGIGSCEIWAIGAGGERMTTEPGWSSGEFAIEPGQTYEWEAQASIPPDPQFRGDWDAVCAPPPEG